MTTINNNEVDYILYDNTILTDSEIKVTSGSICFCSFKKYSYPKLTELNKRVKSLRKQFKDAKVKLNKSNTLAILKCRDEYEAAVIYYNDNYNALLTNWKHAIENGIIKVGYGDNPYYLEHLQKHDFNLQNMRNVDNILNKIERIESKVNKLEESILHGEIEKYISVTI